MVISDVLLTLVVGW